MDRHPDNAVIVNGEKELPTEGAKLAELDKQYVPFPSFAAWAGSTSVDKRILTSIEKNVENLKLKDAEILQRARKVATRAAAINTGAIEDLYEVDRGFTYTVAVETGAWEAAVNDKGNQFRTLFEAQLRAYEYIIDWATEAKPITEVLIRTLHQEICDGQQTYTVHTAVGAQEHELPKGEYKKLPNHVLQRDGTTHSYCPVMQTPDEMRRFVGELASEEFQRASAIQQAAYAHYAFVSIHPFADGNGRVARALASVFTYRYFWAPLLVLVDNRDIYFDALAAADGGDYQPLVEFTATRIRDSVDLIEQSVQTAEHVGIDESISRLRRNFYTPKGFTHAQIDSAAAAVAEVFCSEMRSIAATNADPHWAVTTDVVRRPHYSGLTAPDGYRRTTDGETIYLQASITTQQPAKREVQFGYEVLMPSAAGASTNGLAIWRFTGDGFVAGSDPMTRLNLDLDACIPRITFAGEMKLRMFAERVLATMFSNAAGIRVRQKVASTGG